MALLFKVSHLDRDAAVHVISGLTAKWILDCGASTHITNGHNAVSNRIPIDEPTALLTADGVKNLLDAVIVKILFIDGTRKAVVAERSPNLASLGRLIMGDGYAIKEWSPSGGLVFLAPSGRVVPAYLEDFVPVLGQPSLEYQANLAHQAFVNSMADESDEVLADLNADIERLNNEMSNIDQEIETLIDS